MAKAGAVLNVAAMVERPSTGLDESARRAVASILTELVIQTYRVLLRSQVVHWNVVGPLFQPIHKLTERHYSDLFEAVDVMAERIRALGQPVPTGKAAAGLDKALTLGSRITARDMVEELIEDHEELAQLLREGAAQAEEFDDFVTHDLLTDRLAFHEKAIWMLRATVAD